MTTLEYDGDRLVRMVTTREPEWSDEDQAMVLAYDRYEADRCTGCGGDLHETTAADADDGYVIDPPIRCHRCTALMRAAEQYKDSPHPTALMHRVHLRR